MYGNALPLTGAGLTVGGVAVSTMNIVWIAIALVVVGSALLTAQKFGPRIAVEPVPYGVNGTRWAFTKNGKPVFFLRRRKG